MGLFLVKNSYMNSKLEDNHSQWYRVRLGFCRMFRVKPIYGIKGSSRIEGFFTAAESGTIYYGKARMGIINTLIMNKRGVLY